MSVDCFIVAWNESKMIRHTLNHYRQFCTSITVYDNCSSDGMADIIRQEYPDVKIIPFRTNNKIDEREYLRIKNHCWKKSDADWVIVCDADELLYAPYMSIALSTLKEFNCTLPVVRGYNMVSETFPEKYFPQHITDQVTQGMPAKPFNKQIIFSPRHILDINYSPGCHRCHPRGIMLKQVPEPELKLLHYKYLGLDYVKEKHDRYAQRLSHYNKKHNYGMEYLSGTKKLTEQFNELMKNKTEVISAQPVTVTPN